jgi:hypothetical protein
LVALSPKRKALLLEQPDLVRALIASRASVAIPSSVEFDEIWVELQRLLLDCILEGSDEGRADALAPRSGLLFLEDDDIDAARLIDIDRARWNAEWLATLTPEVIERARREGPSPAAQRFPESLGSAVADDEGPSRSSNRRGAKKPGSGEADEALRKLRAFYEEVRKTGRSVLSVRFRE